MDTETFQEQEKRARSRLRTGAVIKAALVAGLITFLLPGGGPWMSFDSGIATMGRVLTASVLLAAALQTISALAYGWVIGLVVYSMSTITGILVGALMGIPLYAASYLIVGNMGTGSNEIHAGIAHLTFALFFSALYKAMAVQAPRDLKA